MYVATFILPAYRSQNPNSTSWILNKTLIRVLILICAAVNGFGAAILWVAEGQYISQCANEANKGFFNSFFWAVLQMSGVIGNLMAAYVISSVEQSTFYLVMTSLCVLASFFFLLLRIPLKEGLEVPENLAEPKIQQSVKEDIKETWNLLINPRMLKLVPLFILSAFSIGIFAAVLVPLMTDAIKANPDTQDWDSAQSNKFCLLAMIGLGVGEMGGAILFGKIQDKMGNKVAVILCMILSLIGTAAALTFTFVFSFTLWLAVIMTFTWGVQDGALSCLVNCIAGFQFDSKTTPFSVLLTVRNFSIFIFISVESVLKTKEDFVIYFASEACWGIIAYMVVLVRF
jgi:MFS family permease